MALTLTTNHSNEKGSETMTNINALRNKEKSHTRWNVSLNAFATSIWSQQQSSLCLLEALFATRPQQLTGALRRFPNKPYTLNCKVKRWEIRTAAILAGCGSPWATSARGGDKTHAASPNDSHSRIHGATSTIQLHVAAGSFMALLQLPPLAELFEKRRWKYSDVSRTWIHDLWYQYWARCHLPDTTTRARL